jgi:hypothetical protein
VISKTAEKILPGKPKKKKKTKQVMAVSIYCYGSANWISTKRHKSRDSTLKSQLSVNIWRFIIKGNYYFKKRKILKTILSNHPLHIKGSVNSKNTGLKLNRFMKTATTHSEDNAEFINISLDCLTHTEKHITSWLVCWTNFIYTKCILHMYILQQLTTCEKYI